MFFSKFSPVPLLLVVALALMVPWCTADQALLLQGWDTTSCGSGVNATNPRNITMIMGACRRFVGFNAQGDCTGSLVFRSIGSNGQYLIDHYRGNLCDGYDSSIELVPGCATVDTFPGVTEACSEVVAFTSSLVETTESCQGTSLGCIPSPHPPPSSSDSGASTAFTVVAVIVVLLVVVGVAAYFWMRRRKHKKQQQTSAGSAL